MTQSYPDSLLRGITEPRLRTLAIIYMSAAAMPVFVPIINVELTAAQLVRALSVVSAAHVHLSLIHI